MIGLDRLEDQGSRSFTRPRTGKSSESFIQQNTIGLLHFRKQIRSRLMRKIIFNSRSAGLWQKVGSFYFFISLSNVIIVALGLKGLDHPFKARNPVKSELGGTVRIKQLNSLEFITK
jgi:hypothetical protein